MELRILARKPSPQRQRRLKSCGQLPVLFGLLVVVWLIYLFNVLSMAVGVHKLDPAMSIVATTMEATSSQNKTSSDASSTGTRSTTTTISRDLMSLHHVANTSPQEVPVHTGTTRNIGTTTTTTKKVETTALQHSSSVGDWRKELPAEALALIEHAAGHNNDAPMKKRRPGFQANPFGHMVEPENFLGETATATTDKEREQPLPQQHHQSSGVTPPKDQILTAYLEPIYRGAWKKEPLMTRTTTAKELTPRQYPKLNSCSRLPEQWPVDDYPEDDPFLPWIHDVFPTHDGKHIQFIAQNKRRCRTGTTPDEEAILDHMAPQVSLFQHVPLKKVADLSTPTSPRFRLASHEEADPESMSTRFICRFKPSGEITFSEFNNDYEWAGFRKRLRQMFREDGRDNKQIHTSQLLFKCPIPPSLVDSVKTGASVVDDWATLFVDLIPVRTPPRYGPPEEFLVPKYADDPSLKEGNRNMGIFDSLKAWGRNHILPALEDSGRWENIPICKPSLLTYGKQKEDDSSSQTMQAPAPQVRSTTDHAPAKQHNLVSCLWTSTGYTTRGNRYAINDGQRRLVEWITFNKILGFDHFYIYDNSGAFSAESSLQPVANLFPDDVTLIRWPSRVCNNNPNNVDSVGERSSQYAAESSCRLRFGPHVNWIGQFDVDEYLVPMGNYTSILPLLDKLDQENTKIISFASWRAWPRITHINPPVPIHDKTLCGRSDPCFELSIRKNTTFMEGYNCDRQQPGKKNKVMPAEKQIYRADYVTQHFIHYSTVTQATNLKNSDFKERFGRKRPFPDPLSRFGDEVHEALMLHSKAVARQDTAGWERNCHMNYTHSSFDQCRLGIPWPDGEDEANHKSLHNEDGWLYDCYVNKRVDNFWGPKLRAHMKERGLLG